MTASERKMKKRDRYGCTKNYRYTKKPDPLSLIKLRYKRTLAACKLRDLERRISKKEAVGRIARERFQGWRAIVVRNKDRRALAAATKKKSHKSTGRRELASLR